MNRLFILDDNLDFARTLFNYISSKKLSIQTYKLLIDGEEIIDTLTELRNDDIIILDLEMPKINGIEIINIIKKSKNEYPYIIIISGKPEFILEAKEYNDYIYKIFGKPFLFEKLTETIKEIINQSKSDNLDMMIRNELELFKFNKTTRGYTYLLRMYKICFER